MCDQSCPASSLSQQINNTPPLLVPPPPLLQAISDHAATNAGGWWEVVDGEYTHKFHEVPKVVPLEKRPMKIVIDI